jgi:hypothetical protein
MASKSALVYLFGKFLSITVVMGKPFAAVANEDSERVLDSCGTGKSLLWSLSHAKV